MERRKNMISQSKVKTVLAKKDEFLAKSYFFVKLIFEGTVRVISSDLPLKKGEALIYDGTL